jgi:hypothetical protein
VHPIDGRQRLARMVSKALEHDPMARLPVTARDPLHRLWRSFCRARAIPLPMRHDSEGIAKSQGLALALRAAIERAREARTILVVSDLDAVSDYDTIRLALGLARQKRHRVTFVAPAGPDFTGRASEALSDATRARRNAVIELLTGDERLRLDDARRELARAGANLYVATARDPAARWFRRAAAPARRA